MANSFYHLYNNDNPYLDKHTIILDNTVSQNYQDIIIQSETKICKNREIEIPYTILLKNVRYFKSMR